jgi:hypothetical protein
MNKLTIVAIVAAVAVALYIVFRPGGLAQTGLSAVHPSSAFGATPAGTAGAFSSLAASIASLFGSTGSSGSTGSTPTGTLSPVSASAATNTAAQNAAYAYATDEINNTNYNASLQPIDAPISTTLSPVDPYASINNTVPDLSSSDSGSFDTEDDLQYV